MLTRRELYSKLLFDIAPKILISTPIIFTYLNFINFLPKNFILLLTTLLVLLSSRKLYLSIILSTLYGVFSGLYQGSLIIILLSLHLVLLLFVTSIPYVFLFYSYSFILLLFFPKFIWLSIILLPIIPILSNGKERASTYSTLFILTIISYVTLYGVPSYLYQLVFMKIPLNENVGFIGKETLTQLKPIDIFNELISSSDMFLNNLKKNLDSISENCFNIFLNDATLYFILIIWAISGIICDKSYISDAIDNILISTIKIYDSDIILLIKSVIVGGISGLILALSSLVPLILGKTQQLYLQFDFVVAGLIGGLIGAFINITLMKLSSKYKDLEKIISLRKIEEIKKIKLEKWK